MASIIHSPRIWNPRVDLTAQKSLKVASTMKGLDSNVSQSGYQRASFRSIFDRKGSISKFKASSGAYSAPQAAPALLAHPVASPIDPSLQSSDASPTEQLTLLPPKKLLVRYLKNRCRAIVVWNPQGNSWWKRHTQQQNLIDEWKMIYYFSFDVFSADINKYGSSIDRRERRSLRLAKRPLIKYH